MRVRLPLSAVLAVATLQAAWAFPVQAQNSLSTTENVMSTTINNPAAAFVPEAYVQVAQGAVSVDGEAVVLTRYEREDGRNSGLEGEHFSSVVSESGRLKGFAHISLDLVDRPLPSAERSETIARAFLKEHAPDLLPKMEIHWVDTHDEPIRVERNGRTETVTLTGMKVKARNLEDRLWFWVIVGPDEQPMVFERDITWITFPGHRKTEKWLHDSWLKQQKTDLAKGNKGV
ncbi:hypothetical protein EGT81_06525 [Alcaligenes faecalis]|nr:hypothetical protein EGT81_06525 [Alcaligenes faecalis]